MTVRETIIEQTQELMYRQGYVATSISDIMAASKVGKGQLYHYFSSKKQLGLEVVQSLLATWRVELFEGIFAEDIASQDKFSAMLDWVYHFHKSQDGEAYHGCPLGNLIVELSAQDKDFRALLKEFIDQWLSETARALQDIHSDWSARKSLQEASNVIATIQGSILLLKVNQDLTILTDTIKDLKEKYL